ncbi:MAG: hypothetical protein WCT39_05785 [Candidatus Margulisiibacteriota bacterium]
MGVEKIRVVFLGREIKGKRNPSVLFWTKNPILNSPVSQPEKRKEREKRMKVNPVYIENAAALFNFASRQGKKFSNQEVAIFLAKRIFPEAPFQELKEAAKLGRARAAEEFRQTPKAPAPAPEMEKTAAVAVTPEEAERRRKLALERGNRQKEADFRRAKRLSLFKFNDLKWEVCLKAVRAGKDPAKGIEIEGKIFVPSPGMCHASRCEVGKEKKTATLAKEAGSTARAAEDLAFEALCKRLRVTGQTAKADLRRRWMNGERTQLEAVLQ